VPSTSEIMRSIGPGGVLLILVDFVVLKEEQECLLFEM